MDIRARDILPELEMKTSRAQFHFDALQIEMDRWLSDPKNLSIGEYTDFKKALHIFRIDMALSSSVIPVLLGDYNFFKSFPIPITVYNVGAVQSIAVIAYLGAKIRKTSARALFMLHRTSSPPQAALAVTLKGIAKSLTLDDQRTESILKENITLLGDEQWSNLDYYDFFFSGEEAIKIGLAHEIGEFSPPPGAQVYIVWHSECDKLNAMASRKAAMNEGPEAMKRFRNAARTILSVPKSSLPPDPFKKQKPKKQSK